MDTTTKVRMTVEEFLAWDDQQEAKHEFDGKDVIDVVGCALGHETILANLLFELGMRLRGGPFRVIPSGFRLRAGPAVRLPDAQVLRLPLDSQSTISDQAIAVFEILSSSTARTDRFDKAQDYWATASIQHFVLIEQTFAAAVVLSRGPTAWSRVTVEHDGNLELPAVGTSIPLTDLYRDVTFPADPSSSTAAEEAFGRRPLSLVSDAGV